MRFAGYAALFGTPDAARDTIEWGAFSATLAARREPLPLFWQHRPDQPIGMVEAVSEDVRGLRVIARIDNPHSRAGELLRTKSVSGLSFGYRASRARHTPQGRVLEAIELFEVSLVTHPLQHGARVIGGGKREGPRLKELAVTTSSYGQPIARHHGRMRAAGTIIWATELSEHKGKSGGKKGQPSVTTYAYTTSFAVALSSRPIVGVGRVWADGNLLRGAAGDLKVAGEMRVHTGRGDQAPDPLIAAAQGTGSPAFRDCAYVVFEDLALEEFGNRIPALTFEIIADEGAIRLADLIAPAGDIGASATLAPLAGFANEGGAIAATLETIDTLFPLAIDAGGARLTVDTAATPGTDPPLLPLPARAWEDGDFGQGEGRRDDRDAGERARIEALRYYDIARDFQPGVQRPAGRAAGGAPQTIEFPGAFAADDARALADAAARRSGWRRETLQWRVAELDPAFAPGTDVRVPGKPGVWQVESWEWRERGVELSLTRRHRGTVVVASGDAGLPQPPVDLPRGQTVLRAFALPPVDVDSAAPTIFVAASGGAGWSGAALFVDRNGELVPIGKTGRERATIARLANPLGPSSSLVFERDASLELEVIGGPAEFVPTTLTALLGGTNRLLVGGEVLQFALAEVLAPGRWRLSGLLRGRGGTEAAALFGHSPGTDVVLLDDALVAIDPGVVPPDPLTSIAAIGLGDTEPVYVALANPGLGRRPLCPVHPRRQELDGGALLFGWIRRARGAWTWADGVEAPLVEESELYRVGLGPGDAPLAEWCTSAPTLTMMSRSAPRFPLPLPARRCGCAKSVAIRSPTRCSSGSSTDTSSPPFQERPMTDPLTFPSVTPRYLLPQLFVGQAQKEATVNAAHALADVLLHPAVEGEAAAPPAEPADGECWLVTAPASGAFAGREESIAGFVAGSWTFASPHDGMRVFDKSAGQFRLYRTGWRREEAPPEPTGGTVVDLEARAAIVAILHLLKRTAILPEQ